MVILKSSLFIRFPQIRFAFSTVIDSTTKAPYDFNLSLSVGDNAEQVNQNRKKFFSSLGYTLEEVAFQKQIHSDIVTIVNEPANSIEGDAMITIQKNVPLAVSAADCTPIFLYDSKQNIIAGIHSGWQGTKKQILNKTLDVMLNKFNSVPNNIYAYIGPCISQKHYQVGLEFYDYFDAKYILKNSKNSLYFDMKKCNYDMLISNNIPAENIQVSSLCTYEHKNYFHSYRRNGLASGRMLGAIVLV